MYQDKEIGTYLLAGLFAGFVIVLTNGAIFFAAGTGGVYSTAAGLFNPFSLMYGSMLPPVASGMLLYYLGRIRGGAWVFVFIIGALSFWVISFVVADPFEDYAPFAKEVKHLLLSMTVVCCAGNLLMPLFAGSRKIMTKLI